MTKIKFRKIIVVRKVILLTRDHVLHCTLLFPFSQYVQNWSLPMVFENKIIKTYFRTNVYSRNVILVAAQVELDFCLATIRVCRSRSILRAVARTVWQVYMSDCFYQSSAIGAANRKMTRILQARNPELRCSKKRGAYRKWLYSRGENNVPRSRPLLYFLAIKYSTLMQTGYRSSMLAWSHWHIN